MEARHPVLEVLARHGTVDENHPLMDGRAAMGDPEGFLSAISSHNALGKLPVRKIWQVVSRGTCKSPFPPLWIWSA